MKTIISMMAIAIGMTMNTISDQTAQKKNPYTLV